MTTVTISPKFQVVIPKDIREKLGLEPGQEFRIEIHRESGAIWLLPLCNEDDQQ